MDPAGEPEPRDGDMSDPEGLYIPPPTPEQQMAKGRIRNKVYDREEWQGRPPRETPVMYTPVHKVVLSRTETEPCFTYEDCKLRIREMQRAHMDEEGEPDIKYHFLVGGDGALYEGRGYTTVGRSYPVTPKNLQDLSKSCLEIAFIQKSDAATTEEMQSTASNCITLGRHAGHIYKKFQLYFVANNDIMHMEEMGEPITGEENKTYQSNLENINSENIQNVSNAVGEVPQNTTSDQLDPGQLNMKASASSEDGKPLDTHDSGVEANDTRDSGVEANDTHDSGVEANAPVELDTERDETGKPDLIEAGSAEFPTYSHVPLHNTPDNDTSADEEAGDDEEDKKPANFIYRHVWGAQMPKWINALNLPINKVAISFTETDPCYTQDECVAIVKKLQAKHLEEKGEPDIKHNFLIGGDGQIYEGRGYTRVGPIYPPSVKKIEELNGKSIDIGIIEKHAKPPKEKVVHALSWCLSSGIHQKYIEMNFDTYYIANNEIIHIQHPVKGAEKKPKDPIS